MESYLKRRKATQRETTITLYLIFLFFILLRDHNSLDKIKKKHGHFSSISIYEFILYYNFLNFFE